MTPDFRITAGGEDATTRLRDRLVSLEITDADGGTADELVLSVDNRDGRVAEPALGARLQVWLGWRGQGLSLMGEFAVDEVEGTGPLRQLTITATAADMTGAIRAPRTRAWHAPSLGQIVRTIAGEAGLRPVVSASLAGTAWRYLAQTAESNLHFLTRLARDLDATAKPAGGALVVQRRGEGLSAAGDKLGPAVLGPGDLTDWSWRRDGREASGEVEAEWTDPATGTRETVARGAGTGAKTRLRHSHASRAEAERAAEAALRRTGRGELTLSASLAGFRPDLLAGAGVTLAGFGAPEDGDWHLTEVRHALGQALLTSFEARRAAG